MVKLNMNTKLLKIINELGWIHEEEGKASIWFHREFSPAHLDKLIKEFKNKCLNEFEEYNIKIGSVEWNEDLETYVMDYAIEKDELYILRELFDELRFNYEEGNIVIESETITMRDLDIEINISREIHSSMIDTIITLIKEEILQEEFIEAVLKRDSELVEQIFEEAYQRLQ